MFTQQQKDTMRKVFGFMYDKFVDNDLCLVFVDYKVAKWMNTTEEKAHAILEALCECGYVQKFTENDYTWYEITPRGLKRYEAFLAIERAN